MSLSEETSNPPPYPSAPPSQKALSPVMEKGESKVLLDSCLHSTPIPVTVQPQPNGKSGKNEKIIILSDYNGCSCCIHAKCA